jgi:flagellar motility protein MotE (MotC chaperone)
MPPEAEYEKTSYGTFERFLYLFFIPIIFSAILTFVMLSIFGINVMNTVLTVGNKLPFIEKIVPEPAAPPVTDEEASGNTNANNEETSSKLLELEEQLLVEVNLNQQKQTEIAELQQMIDDLKEELNIKLQSDEEYTIRIQQLANVYAKMMPNRAAPIIENLTLSERVLVMNEIPPADQIEILEKMNPAMAAETSILMKDQILAKDVQIAALQERLALNNDNSILLLSIEELSLTFASMTPANAAVVLLEMMKISEDKVIAIMRNMNVQARSQLLNAITDISESDAAKISAKLG